jgi:hypothetical protein
MNDKSNINEYQYELEPWSEIIEGKKLLNEIYATLQKAVYLKEDEYLTISYWILHTYFIRPKGIHQAFRYSPILLLSSPLRACGKSTLMLLLAELSHKSRKATNITDASLYRLLDSFQPTLFLDEIDTYLAKREEMFGHLNSGFDEREGSVFRQSGSDWSQTAEYSVWSAKCLAGIGTQPPNLESRSIKIQLERKPTDTKLESLQETLAEDPNCFSNIKRKCIKFATDFEQKLISQKSIYLENLSDRNNDCWSSLLKIAALIEPDNDDLKNAAINLSHSAPEEKTESEDFMLDLKEFVTTYPEERLPSLSIVNHLKSLDDRPHMHKRGGFNAYDLAMMLKPFGIKPKQYKIVGKNLKGYEKSELQSVIRKYLG